MDTEPVEGWKWPQASKKCHWYSRGAGISLCGKWMYGGPFEMVQGVLGERPGRDDCAVCFKRAKKNGK
jgi:hypothetical protein